MAHELEINVQRPKAEIGYDLSHVEVIDRGASIRSISFAMTGQPTRF